MNKVDLWVASFKLVNALGTSDYWNGIAADKTYVDDYIFKDFGDSQETMIATALAHSLSSTRLKVAAPSVAAEAPRKKVELKKINSVPIRVLHK